MSEKDFFTILLVTFNNKSPSLTDFRSEEELFSEIEHANNNKDVHSFQISTGNYKEEKKIKDKFYKMHPVNKFEKAGMDNQ